MISNCVLLITLFILRSQLQLLRLLHVKFTLAKLRLQRYRPLVQTYESTFHSEVVRSWRHFWHHCVCYHYLQNVFPVSPLFQFIESVAIHKVRLHIVLVVEFFVTLERTEKVGVRLKLRHYVQSCIRVCHVYFSLVVMPQMPC